MSPQVSFVVPCYQLAHLLGECVNSILSQTFGDFEILIMDDCSPDNTPLVAASYADPRVRHVRNDPNLGHLRNYNKGISLARGRYTWLISADDRLRTREVLARYVDVMDRHPNAGFVFCPGIGLENGQETGLLEYAWHGSNDRVFDRREFFVKLLNSNSVLAASGMVRASVYRQLGVFPLNMPFAADWYLWLLFSLHHDVAYIGEPSVHYRQHGLNMTNRLNERDPRICTKDDLRVLWQIKARAEEAGHHELCSTVQRFIVERATRFLASERNRGSRPWYTFDDFEESVTDGAASRDEARRVRSQVYAAVADCHFWQRSHAHALDLYRRSLRVDATQPKVWLQYLLLRLGRPGIYLREARSAMRHAAADPVSRADD
jgi:glycosyltransferase involved in cell wall biosynthesis